MKLYEILLRKIGLWNEFPKTEKQELAEDKIYNPIGCKVGGVVKIDSLDFRDYRFTVKEIVEYSIEVGKKHVMTDYVLLARPIGKNDFVCRLRVVPDPTSHSKFTHRALILSLYDELAYDEDLHNVVLDDTKKFVIDDDKDDDDASNDEHSEFWRVNDVGVSYNATLKTLKEDGFSGSAIDFWDYSRMTDLDGVEMEEFVFVEMDKCNGWFQIWRGTEVSPERIEVF
jgi:hypothetical protein